MPNKTIMARIFTPIERAHYKALNDERKCQALINENAANSRIFAEHLLDGGMFDSHVWVLNILNAVEAVFDVVIIDKADFDKYDLGVAPVVERIKVRNNS